MLIRLTEEKDLEGIDIIFAKGREQQHREGNYSQWNENYPNLDIVRQDIIAGIGWVCVDKKDDTVLGTWALGDHEDVYDHLKFGQWNSHADYKVIHRMGTLSNRGIGEFILRHLQQKYSYLRVDTFEKNRSMLALLKKVNFNQCGVAYYEGYGDMLTFDYIRPDSHKTLEPYHSN